MQKLNRILISRTDGIGDVILTLPMVGLIKKRFPDAKILFLGKTYTKDIISLCDNIAGFYDYDEVLKLSELEQINYFRSMNADAILHVFPVSHIAKLAKKARIPIRIGTSHRFYNLIYCNKLVHFSRKNSDMHEAQLNIKLLRAIGILGEPTREELAELYGLKTSRSAPLEKYIENDGKFNLILHPKSKGSAKEWSLDNWSKLIELASSERFNIYVSGTAAEGAQMKDFLSSNADKIIDITGRFSLAEFIAFIDSADGLIAASTGPLHIAAMLGKRALGLFPAERPINPTRWAPIGKMAEYITDNTNSEGNQLNISPIEVAKRINAWL